MWVIKLKNANGLFLLVVAIGLIVLVACSQAYVSDNDVVYMEDEPRDCYVVQLFHDFIDYSHNSAYHLTGNSWDVHASPMFRSYSERIQQALIDDVNLFIDAIMDDVRIGRKAVLMAQFFIGNETINNEVHENWFKIWDVLLENHPTAEYVENILNDQVHMWSIGVDHGGFGSENLLFQSRMWHVFYVDVVSYLEGLGKVEAQEPGAWIVAYAIQSITTQIALARDTDHPFFYERWMGLIMDAKNLTLSENAAQILTRLYEETTQPTNLLWFTQRDDIQAYEHDMHKRTREWVQPLGDAWVDDHWDFWLVGGVIEFTRNHLEFRFRYYIAEPRILLFPFWRWLDTENVYWIPDCPIWVISLLREPLRDQVIDDLLGHLVYLRDGGYGVYVDILNMLTDESRVFDATTQDTFDRVNRMINITF